MRYDWVALLALAVLGLFCLAALLAPVIAPYDPYKVDMIVSLTPPAFVNGGDPAHWLGTDSLGRDVLTRLVFGARVSLLVGFSTVILGAIVGLVLGFAFRFLWGMAGQPDHAIG